MATGRFISYLRVSTNKQGKSGLGLEAQRNAVLGYLNGGSWEHVAEYIEVESGKKSDRTQLAAALAHCKKIKGTLLIAKLDRLARKVSFIANLMDSGADFIACDMPNATPFMLHVYAAVAEEEARAVSIRTKAALAAAKANGRKLGGFRAGAGVSNKLAADSHARSVQEALQKAVQAGWSSLREIATYLDANGVRTVSGKPWTAVQVSRVMKRI